MIEPSGDKPTLHDTVSAAFDATVGKEPEAKEVIAPVDAVVKEPAPLEVPKTSRTAGRERDEGGRLLPGKAAKPDKQAKEPLEAKTEVTLTAEAPAPKPRPQRPDTWKKEMWPHWEKIDPELADYLVQREREASQGIGTYKQKFEAAKPVVDAIEPYQQFLKQHGMKPETFVAALAQSEQTLRFGTEEQKLKLLATMINDYRIPLHQLLVRGEDGGVYFNQQYFTQPAQGATAQGMAPEDVERIVSTRLQQVVLQNAVQSFATAKDRDGSPLYPHFQNEKVRASMDAMLRSGMYQDLPSAYQAALRLPEFSDIFEAEQTKLREAEEAEKQRKQQAETLRAKRDTVSSKSSAPAGVVRTEKTRKGLRDTVEDAFDKTFGGARV